MWERRAETAAYCRAEGREYCLVDFETIRDDGAEVGVQVTRDGYEKKFAKWWAEYKPHLIRDHLPEWAQELIAKLEGTTLAEIKGRQAELQDLL
jgi:hypothetical protein